MYAHEIIDHFKKSFEKNKNYPDNKTYCEALLIATKAIQNSEHFHIDDAVSVAGFRGIDSDKICIFTDMLEYLKLPYPMTYFDFDISKVDEQCYEGGISKYAAICIESPEGKSQLKIFIVTYHYKPKIWVLSPLQYFIELRPYEKDNGNVYSRGMYDITAKINASSEELKEMLLDRDSMALSVVNCAILLLNCRNVVHVMHEHLPTSKLNKKRIRNKQCPTFTYRTLQVQLSKPKIKSLNPLKQSSTYHQAIHMCRGHYKEYTKEKPLFGKYTGLYWWEPFARGRDSSRVIVKDYELITDTKKEKLKNDHPVQGLSTLSF